MTQLLSFLEAWDLHPVVSLYCCFLFLLGFFIYFDLW